MMDSATKPKMSMLETPQQSKINPFLINNNSGMLIYECDNVVYR